MNPDVANLAKPVDWAVAVGVVLAATGLAELASSLLALPDVVMLYLAGIVLVAMRSRRGPTLLAAALSVAAYDFTVIPPRFSFAIDEGKHAMTFAMMFGVGWLVSSLMERLQRQEAATRAVEMEASVEAHRSALLSAVSHDLRTPLAAITGIATDLRERIEQVPPAERAQLLDTVVGEAERLERLVANLLEMTRLDSGVVLKREWVPVEELVGSALTRLEKTLGARPVKVEVAPGLPLK